jgi:hypothetical protein
MDEKKFDVLKTFFKRLHHIPNFMNNTHPIADLSFSKYRNETKFLELTFIKSYFKVSKISLNEYPVKGPYTNNFCGLVLILKRRRIHYLFILYFWLN